MGQLLVRDLDDEVIRRLNQLAAAHGRSTEAEHRAILEAAVRGGAVESPIQASLHFRREIVPCGPEGADIIRQARDERAQRTP